MASDQDLQGPSLPPIEPQPDGQQQQTADVRNDNALDPPRALPERDVSLETIEDAYVNFMLYCNPALPPDCDIESLREAFRMPPKSQGKEFSPWLVFQKVKQFYSREIPTWTEMVIRLGVDEPDVSKGESSQKLTQYGVRLKKWLQSYHVKPFFEYLMGIDNEYWTHVPTDSDPTRTPVRDGIHIEDDMALRCLLPHIRPKRGRKRPQDYEVSTPLSARPISFASPWQPTGGTPLSAHPGNTPSAGHPLLAPNDGSHTPLSRYPSSAITPTTRGGFWDSPSTPQRRGAKGVSSAWKIAGQDNGKTRGRPPMEKTPVQGPGSAFSEWPRPKPSPPPRKKQNTQTAGSSTPTGASASQIPSSNETHPIFPGAPVAPMPASQPPAPTLDRTTSAPAPPARSWSQSDGPRPSRPSISLQVPQRPGGNVRLATPPPPTAPPALMVNGEHHQQPPQHYPPHPQTQKPQEYPPSLPYEHPSTQLPENAYYDPDQPSNTTGEPGVHIPPITNPSEVEDYYFEKTKERTNVDTLISFFMRATQDGQWFDQNGQPAEAASMEEAAAITNCTLQEMLKTATSPQAFLINLGALAGARTLMTTRPKYYRMPDGDDCHNYKFEWEYTFGHLQGHFNMIQRVPWTMWKKPLPAWENEDVGERDGGHGMSAEEWKEKYKALLGEMKKREQELADLRGKVMSSLREDLI